MVVFIISFVAFMVIALVFREFPEDKISRSDRMSSSCKSDKWKQKHNQKTNE